MNEDEIKYEGFEQLEEHGFVCEYVKLLRGPEHRVCAPMFTVESVIEAGFFPKDTKVRWVDHNGYDHDRDHAREVFDTEKFYTVKTCSIGRSSSSYAFNEVDGKFNTVMFERVE